MDEIGRKKGGRRGEGVDRGWTVSLKGDLAAGVYLSEAF